jgi:glyoxylase-like metal-dependent hydrolase (beta-lactamase superfamily II)
MLQLFEGDGGAIDAARAPQFSFLATPGHTPGHIVVCITPAGEAAPRAVYVGDALHVRCMCAARAAHALRTRCTFCMLCIRRI